MLCRTKHGDLSFAPNFFKILAPVLLYSSASPASRTAPDPLRRRSKPNSGRPATKSPVPHPADSIVASSGSPDVRRICSLLSGEGVDVSKFDSLLRDYKGKLHSPLVLDVLRNYRILGRLRTLEFVSWAGKEMGFRFDDFLVEYVVDFLCRRKLFDDMKCFLVAVSSQKDQVSCRVFAICIRFLGRHGKVKEALCLFEEMEAKFRCKPDNFVYNNMLYVLCKKENWEQLVDVALSIFRRIEAPDMLCKVERLEEAERVYKIMKKRCEPDNVTYTALIHAYGGANRWESAHSLLIEMLSSGIFPHFDTCSLVDRLLKENHRVDLSERLEGKVESQILLKHCKLGRLEAAYEKLVWMLKKGLHPPVYVMDALPEARQRPHSP